MSCKSQICTCLPSPKGQVYYTAHLRSCQQKIYTFEQFVDLHIFYTAFLCSMRGAIYESYFRKHH